MNYSLAAEAPAPASSGAGVGLPGARRESAPRQGGKAGVDLSELYSEHYRSLVRFLYRQTGDQGLAEDLAQEAFVRAIQHEPEQPKAWLFQVAANLARDDHRRRAVRRRHLALVGNEAGSVPASGGRPDVDFERNEEAALVRAALDELAPKDRDGLLLKEEGLSYDEIAEVLELSPASVGTTLSRARSRLAAAYERLAAEGSRNDAAS